MSSRPNRCAWPLWRQRLVCVGFAFGLLALLELVCVWFDWGLPARFDDPYVGFRQINPLFIPDEAGQYVTAPSRRKHFPLEKFARKKADGAFRVFCFGGSTVQGNPYAKETAFPRWLELSLRAAEPQRHFEVINCGGISYASYRLVPIMEECLAYEPDLFIFCEGHNEFLEDRTYTGIKHVSPVVSHAETFLGRLRTATLMRQGWMKLFDATHVSTTANPQPVPRAILKDEVDPVLDYEGGIKAYHRDESWRADVMAHFEVNLRRMAALTHSAHVPLIFVRPVSNLRDCPPFKSQHRDDLTPEELEQWKAFNAEAVHWHGRDPQQELSALQSALALDSEYALTFYHLGKCFDALGQPARAREAYFQARELDVCPLRILEPMETALAGVARETHTPLVDAQALLEAQSRDGITGDDWLVDHVHPSIKGHQLIAAALFDELARAQRIHPATGWEAERKKHFDTQMAELPPNYLRDGERALAGLRAWTQGRASGPPIEYHVLGSTAAKASRLDPGH